MYSEEKKKLYKILGGFS